VLYSAWIDYETHIWPYKEYRKRFGDKDKVPQTFREALLEADKEYETLGPVCIVFTLVYIILTLRLVCIVLTLVYIILTLRLVCIVHTLVYIVLTL